MMAKITVFEASGKNTLVRPSTMPSVKPVTILRDYGTSVEIASGVTRQDRVIDNPPDALKPGDEVRVAKS